MTPLRSSLHFLALVCAAALFVWITSPTLPPIVASHFDGAGTADGFMTRQFYTWFMLAFVVGLPLVLVYLPTCLLRSPRARINVPNREHWLAPERKEDTIEFLCRHMTRFGLLLLLFLCYVHWLVIDAHGQVPPRLSSPWFIGGLVGFVVLSIAWAGALLVRFRRMPSKGA